MGEFLPHCPSESPWRHSPGGLDPLAWSQGPDSTFKRPRWLHCTQDPDSLAVPRFSITWGLFSSRTGLSRPGPSRLHSNTLQCCWRAVCARGRVAPKWIIVEAVWVSLTSQKISPHNLFLSELQLFLSRTKQEQTKTSFS